MRGFLREVPTGEWTEALTITAPSCVVPAVRDACTAVRFTECGFSPTAPEHEQFAHRWAACTLSGFHIRDDVKVSHVVRVDVRNGLYPFYDIANWVLC